MDPTNNNSAEFASLNPRHVMGLTEEEIREAKERAERDPDQNEEEELQRAGQAHVYLGRHAY